MSENTISKPTKKMKANKFYIHLCVFLSSLPYGDMLK